MFFNFDPPPVITIPKFKWSKDPRLKNTRYISYELRSEDGQESQFHIYRLNYSSLSFNVLPICAGDSATEIPQVFNFSILIPKFNKILLQKCLVGL
mgnify:CR=1 FL=1